MIEDILRKGTLSKNAPVELVGGKGHNLFRLSSLEVGEDFSVPDFYVIPAGLDFSEKQLRAWFDFLKGPLAIRSSSPHEDSKGFSFAGRYKSVLGIDKFIPYAIAVSEVLESAKSSIPKDYAAQYGITIDNRMAVIIQKMIDPFYSGVCYSSSNPDDPKTVIEYIGGLSDKLMSGNIQGNIASFDRDDKLKMEQGNEFPGLKRVASVARRLEEIFSERLDIEFAFTKDDKIHILQARPVTDPKWPKIQLPELDSSRIFLEADIVRGSGIYNGKVFALRSPQEMIEYCKIHNKHPMTEIDNQWAKLREFNKENPNGYCLIADNLERHQRLMENEGLSNLRALVTVDYASRFSHPIKVVSETGAFYLGVLGRKDLLELIDTGDTITIASDQSRGLIYDLTKLKSDVVEREKVNLEKISTVPYISAIKMWQPSYEAIDDRLFVDRTGNVGVLFWDYNEDNGVPAEVFYHLIDVDKGDILSKGEYHPSRVMHRYGDFPSLLNNLLAEAKSMMKK